MDAEQVSRFQGPAPGNPLPLVFSDGEAAHAAASGNAAWCLCAAFCVKEALLKALGEALDPRECEVFAEPGEPGPDGALEPRWRAGPGLRQALAGAVAEVRLREAPGGELVATVILSEAPGREAVGAAGEGPGDAPPVPAGETLWGGAPGPAVGALWGGAHAPAVGALWGGAPGPAAPVEVPVSAQALTVPLTVEFEDVDAYGIAHHARMVAWLERARLRYLLERGLPVHPEGCTPVMYDLQVRFRSPARLMDRLEVTVEPVAADDFTLTLAYRIRRGDEVLARARTVIAFRDAGADAPAPVPESFRPWPAGGGEPATTPEDEGR